MNYYLRERALENWDYSSVAQFVALAGVAIFLPFVLHAQLITGPIINAIFVLALFLLGIRSAMVIALVPSLMALSGGLLPAVLAPAVPFIMIGNVIFIIAIDFFYNRTQNKAVGYWFGVVSGSALKFAFLFLSVTWIQDLLIKQSLATKVAQMMSWPQFATAVVGGGLAWAILKGLKKI